MNRRMGTRGSATTRSLRSKLSVALMGASLTTVVGGFGCEGGGGTFVGQERPAESGVTCDQCLPAIDPTPVDCAAAEAGVEFYPAPILSFDTPDCQVPVSGPDPCEADNFYAYQDGTITYSTLTDSWKPDASETVRCKGEGPTMALNVKAGPFTNWGGGLGRNLKCMNGSTIRGRVKGTDEDGEPTASAISSSQLGCDPEDHLQACDPSEDEDANGNPLTEEQQALLRTACPQRDLAAIESSEEASPQEAAPEEEEFMLGVTLDLTEWDGISFWARRSSNDAEVGIRVVLGDKHTSDDLSFLQYHVNPDDERYCERNVECGCQGNSPCSERFGTLDSEEDGVIPSTEEDGTLMWACWDTPPWINADGLPVYNPCGNSVCESPYDAYEQIPDLQRADTTCNTFTYRGGDQESLCYDPEDGPFPVERTQKCGDHWVHPIRLSTEWQFYKVPFTSLLQEGWAKESFKLDLTSAAVVRFTWSTGWHDFWVDDVRFYRNKHNTSGGGE